MSTNNMNLENPATSTELRFFLGILFQYIVGILITSGHLDPSVRDQLVSQLVDFTGYAIILVTSGIALFHLAKTSHKLTAMPKAPAPQVTEVKITQQAPTAAPVVQNAPSLPIVDGGSPLSPSSVINEVQTLLKSNETK